MAKFCSLFSSSDGNCTYIGCSQGGILIDVGVSAKRTEQALANINISPSTIEAIFVTHEHIDHCAALKVFAKRYDLPIYATKGTLEALTLSNKVDANAKLIEISDEIVLGDMLIKRLDTSHDARQSCGYFITTADNRRCSVVTDTGFLTQNALEFMKQSNAVVIESNHDINMLKNGPYPYVLKQRVLSMTGHLSNVDCAKALPTLVENGVTRFLLAHLSQENNTRTLALETSIAALSSAGMQKDSDYTIDTAPVDTNGKSVIF